MKWGGENFYRGLNRDAVTYLTKSELVGSSQMSVYSVVGRHQRIRETYCLHLQDWNGDTGKYRNLSRAFPPITICKFHFPPSKLKPWRWRQNVSPKRWYLPTSLHGVKTRKNIVILIALRTLSFTWSLGHLAIVFLLQRLYNVKRDWAMIMNSEYAKVWFRRRFCHISWY
jgi:hypothetical protein